MDSLTKRGGGGWGLGPSPQFLLLAGWRSTAGQPWAGELSPGRELRPAVGLAGAGRTGTLAGPGLGARRPLVAGVCSAPCTRCYLRDPPSCPPQLARVCRTPLGHALASSGSFSLSHSPAGSGLCMALQRGLGRVQSPSSSLGPPARGEVAGHALVLPRGQGEPVLTRQVTESQLAGLSLLRCPGTHPYSLSPSPAHPQHLWPQRPLLHCGNSWAGVSLTGHLLLAPAHLPGPHPPLGSPPRYRGRVVQEPGSLQPLPSLLLDG